MRDIVYLFPKTESAFLQRKTFDEYYWDRELLLVDISVEKIQGS